MREIHDSEIGVRGQPTYPEWAKIIVLKKCWFCGKNSVVGIEYDEADRYYEWANEHKKIQDVFPDISPNIRELLISGTHSECWDRTYPRIAGELKETT